MNRLYALLILLISACTLNAQIVDVDVPNSYLPTELANFKLGMPIADFHKLSDTTKLERDASSGFRFIKFTKPSVGGSIQSVYFKFDTPQNGINKSRPLYEIAITFTSAENADAFVKAHFTSPYRSSDVAEKEWFLSTTKDYWLIVRKKDATVTFAATMSGTEWGFE